MSTPNTTAGLTQVAALRLKAGNDLVTNATIYFTPVDNQGRAVSLRDGQASGNQGLHTGDAFQAPVTSGGFTIVVPDVSVSTPAYVGYRVDIESTATGKLLPFPGFACYQPTGLNVDFDATATPDLSPGIPFVAGPPGAPGPLANILVDQVDGSYWQIGMSGGAPTYTFVSTTTGAVNYIALTDSVDGSAWRLTIAAGTPTFTKQ